MITLLLTARGDATADLLMPHFSEDVVRMDLDFLHLDKFRWNSEALTVGHRHIHWTDVTAVYWRKPADPIRSDLPQLDGYELRQRLHVFRCISAFARKSDIWHLVDPLHEYKFPKPLQLLLAERYLPTPQWEVTTGLGAGISGPLVTKALSPVPVVGERGAVTALVPDPDRLDPRFTWHLQSAVVAPLDATVVYCAGRIWGFTLERPMSGEWIDWRLVMSNHRAGAWKSAEVPPPVVRGIHLLMGELGLHYGRIDFLVDSDGKWWFLEINPNGQFAWLDPINEHGICSAIASAAECKPTGSRT